MSLAVRQKPNIIGRMLGYLANATSYANYIRASASAVEMGGRKRGWFAALDLMAQRDAYVATETMDVESIYKLALTSAWFYSGVKLISDRVSSRESAMQVKERTGEECLATNVDMVLTRIRAKYKEYGINSEPFVIVKADAGTYGMGIMTIKDASEVKGLNRKQRNKMAVVKEGMAVTEVIIQEGVPTVERVDEGTAEPVVYMIDRFVVGGFYRVNTARGIDENLNAPGMTFKPLAFDTGCSLPNAELGPDAPPNRFYAYGVVARLALVAAALELERAAPKD